MTAESADGPAEETGAARFWWAVLPAMVVPLLGALFYFVWFADSSWVWGLYSATKLFTLCWPLLAWRWLLGRPLPMPRPSAAWLRAVPLGLATGLGVVALLWLVLQTPLYAVVLGGREAIQSRVESFGLMQHYWLFALLLSTVHAALEEYYWRWFVFGRLAERLRSDVAHGLAALAFAAHHVVVAAVFFGLAWGLLLGTLVGIGGLLWSLLYRRQGNWFGAWVSHMVVDLGLMAVGYGLLTQ